MAGRLRRQLRSGVPRRAAGMPDPDDAAEPEVFRAGRRRAAGSPIASSSSATSRPPTRRRSCRATSACCAHGSPTPRFFFDQDKKTRLEARVPKLATVVYHNRLGTQLDRVERVRGAGRGDRPDDRRRRGDGDACRAPRQGRSRDRHGRRIPRAARVDGPLLRRARRRARRRRARRSSSTTGRASPATRCRTAPSPRPWRWPTSSRRSPACSASARSLPATGTRSACGATRSA